MTLSVALGRSAGPETSLAPQYGATRPAPGGGDVPWTGVAVGRRDGRAVTDLRRGALAPYVLDDDGRVVRVALVATGALLLGGDHVRLRVRVGRGAALELVETSGTVAYDGRGRRARWEVDVVVEDGGVLVWDGQPFVVATGADVRRTTSVQLGAGAVALLRETVVLGRSGERGGRLRTALRVDGPRGPVLVDELRLDGTHPQPGVLGDHRVLDAVVLVGRRARTTVPGGAGVPGATGVPGSSPVTVLDLEEDGTVARRLGGELHRVALTDVAVAWGHDAVHGRA